MDKSPEERIAQSAESIALSIAIAVETFTFIASHSNLGTAARADLAEVRGKVRAAVAKERGS